ncbi:MAG TPA: bidirectional hydrogenase complex protein HoxE [Oscillatoriales cyanobacterium M4454_W2019_049]|nr:bidirectional hydrogenase complex protein HoxE [Oscillatoriales cyanobacterium M4454_W2019_049]
MTPTTTEKNTAKIARSAAPKTAAEDKRFKVLTATMKRHHYQQDALIEVLHKAQESFGFLEPEVLEFVARGLKLPLSRVYGVATFYHLFSLKPNGKHTCVVCMGTACYVKGSDKILTELEKKLGVKVGETSADGEVSLMSARCLGACGIAPAVVFDGEVAGQQEPEEVLAKLKDWQE